MIVDANVVARWVLQHPDSAAAVQFLGRMDLKAPSTLLAEVAHALTREVRRRRLSEEQLRRGWNIVRQHPLAITPVEVLIDAAVDLSVRLHASSHDCIYLALALREDEVLVTADGRFHRAAESVPDTKGRVVLLTGS